MYVWNALPHLTYLVTRLSAQSIFSSDLVRLKQNDPNNSNNGEHIVVSRQIWIYLIISGSLTFLTLMATLLQKKN